jgi:hypothetical protein
VPYYLLGSSGTRTITAKLKTGGSGYNAQIVINRTYKSPEDFIAVKWGEGKVTVFKPGLTTAAESSGGIIAENTEYSIAVTIANPVGGAYVVKVYVNGVEVVKYELTAEDITNLAENAGEIRKRDGFRWVKDTTSAFKEFRVVPSIA